MLFRSSAVIEVLEEVALSSSSKDSEVALDSSWDWVEEGLETESAELSEEREVGEDAAAPPQEAKSMAEARRKVGRVLLFIAYLLSPPDALSSDLSMAYLQ